MKSSPLILHFPASYQLAEKFLSLRKLNSALHLELKSQDELWIFEKDFSFAHFESVDLYFPENQLISYQELLELEVQSTHYRLEQTPQKIIIIMATSSLIGFLTFAVLGSIYLWISKTKKGRGYAETTPYKFVDEHGHEIRREADASFIAFEDCSEEVQNSWEGGAAQAPPTFVVEVVSAKYGTKSARKKMEEVWMYHGAKVGIVICPFTEKIYVYDQNGTSEQSTDETFQHPDLEGYEGDFSKEIQTIQQELEKRRHKK